jgi:hypothetical protein
MIGRREFRLLGGVAARPAFSDPGVEPYFGVSAT